MASTTPLPAVEAVDVSTENVENVPKVKKITLNRALKKIETVESKNARLAADNKKLKAQLAEVRSAHSRIRRIPKAAPVVEA
jgi:chaperonin cofactor prefoldin